MARPWRLRHKLFLGLGLVVGSIALLLGGAVFGLLSYVEAGQIVDHKLHQLQVTVVLRDQIHQMADNRTNPDGKSQNRQEQQQYILHWYTQVRNSLDYYRETRKSDQNSQFPDPDDGEGQRHALAKIDTSLAKLKQLITTPGTRADSQGDQRVIDDPAVRAAYHELMKESTNLFAIIKTDIDDTFRHADTNRRRGTAIAVSGTVVAALLILTMLYYFKVWVFTPIRLLQAGVQRVHNGDFEHPIQLQSQDELEELGNEFDAMTARFRDIYKDLAQQINDRSRQLVRSERMVSVGFLAAGVAHEINNPLHSIYLRSDSLVSRLGTLTKNLAPADATVLTDYLRVIQQEADRCKQIVNKLLDFSRSGEGRRDATDMGRLIQEVIDIARPLPNFGRKRIEYQPVYLLAEVCPGDLKSVVLNLIVNALDSMDDDGVLRIAVGRVGEVAELRFQDSGCGMTPEVLEHIFEPFFTRRRTGNGTGLGLSISHQIIDQHGGTISAASDGPGRGSAFVIRVPMRAVAAKTEPADAKKPESMPAIVPLWPIAKAA